MCRTLFRDKPETTGRLLLEFVILTACRSGEARGMTWSEIDQAKAIWTIPVGRTATVHGFRSSFRDWASEHAYPRDLAERALSHTSKDAT
jgi:integrase